MRDWVECKENIYVKNQSVASIICLLNSIWDVFIPHSEKLIMSSIFKSQNHLLLKKRNIMPHNSKTTATKRNTTAVKHPETPAVE